MDNRGINFINTLKRCVFEEYTIEEISRTVKLAPTTVRYWLNKHGLKTINSKNPKKWNKEELSEMVRISDTKSDVLRLAGLNTKSAGNYKTFDKYIKLYEIDTSHFNRFVHRNRFANSKSVEECLCKDSQCNNKSVIKLILRHSLILHECYFCGINSEWNGKPLVLQLDHIDGVSDNNSINNLRFLCPNCHSQTDTFGSKNINNKK